MVVYSQKIIVFLTPLCSPLLTMVRNEGKIVSSSIIIMSCLSFKLSSRRRRLSLSFSILPPPSMDEKIYYERGIKYYEENFKGGQHEERATRKGEVKDKTMSLRKRARERERVSCVIVKSSIFTHANIISHCHYYILSRFLFFILSFRQKSTHTWTKKESILPPLYFLSKIYN